MIVFVRFVVVCGDGEYIIYTAMALRNKSFGSAQEFVWASDSSEYVQSLSNRLFLDNYNKNMCSRIYMYVSMHSVH